MKTFFQAYKDELQVTLNALNEDILEQVYQIIETARKREKQVFILGNGGSSASASHWVCDFAKGINAHGSKRLKIFSPADSMPVVTALGNDMSFDDSFSEQLKNYLSSDDVVISLSVSGNSPNLLTAHRYARSIGAKTVAIIGDYSGKLEECSDITLTLPSKNYGIVEDLHLTVCHVISQYIKKLNEQAGQDQ